MKKLLAFFGLGSVAAFVAIFLSVAHFGRNQLLFGTIADVQTTASATLFSVIKFLFSLLYAGAVMLRDYGLLVLLLFAAAAVVAIFLSRPHVLDASLLAGIATAGFAVFWFFITPWLFVSKVVQNRGLHPKDVISGSDRISTAARENWSCLVCSSVKETRFRQLACAGDAHDPDSCAGHVQRRFAGAAAATLLLVGALAYVMFARGSWIDRASPGSGFVKTTLAALSLACVIAVSLNVYAVGYVYGKTSLGFELEKVRQIQADFTSDPLFVITRTPSAATLFFTIEDVRNIELGEGIRLEPAGTANILTEVMTSLAEAELASEEDPFFRRN